MKLMLKSKSGGHTKVVGEDIESGGVHESNSTRVHPVWRGGLPRYKNNQV